MSKKSKGFTLVEVIISVAISTMILGVIGTFFITNSKTLAEADARSTLQTQGESIQNSLIDKVNQCNNISQISIGSAITPVTYVSSSARDYTTLNSTDPDFINSVQINGIEFYDAVSKVNGPIDDVKITFTLNNTELRMITKDHSDVEISNKLLSDKVTEFRVRPLDATTAVRSTTTFNDTMGLEVFIKLEIKKGYTDETYPITTIIKFRNRNAANI